MKLLIRLLNHSVTRRVVIPILLLLVWLIATIYIVIKSDISLSVMSKTYDRSAFKQTVNVPLLKGRILSGEFKAKEDNLGIVLLRFDTRGNSIEDRIVFRLKEKNSPGWYFTSAYNTDQIVHDSLFPFGFSKITSSKNKSYYFEVESLHGVGDQSISLSSKEPALMTKYQFEKSALKSSPKLFVYFFIHKSIGALQDKSNLYLSLSFVIPFILYIVSFTFLRYFSQYKILNIKYPDLAALNQLTVLIYTFLLIFYIFIIRQNIYPVNITILILWVILVKKYTIGYRLTFLFSSILLIISWISSFVFPDYNVEKVVFIGNLILAIGGFQLFQQLYDLSKKNS